MRIRHARQNDRNSVLEFCKDTFSWGDYIAEVWDSWSSKGGLHVVEKDGLVIGVYNLELLKKESWIEGMRVRPQFRKMGFGTKMLSHAESIIQNGIIRLIIESENRASIKLVTSMGYEIEERWRLYSMMPEKQNANTTIATKSTDLGKLASSSTYADSWRWLPLDKEDLEKLVEQNRIVVSIQNGKSSAMGIWNKSNDFPDVFQMGFVNGTQDGIKEILKCAQNQARDLGCERIQVFAHEKISLESSFLDKRSLFYLMKKEL